MYAEGVPVCGQLTLKALREEEQISKSVQGLRRGGEIPDLYSKIYLRNVTGIQTGMCA